ncbi:MAG: dienelactone hydrolase family protein [Nitrospirae bacterium]|nr:MAG: dienelactone hydrolase family protein [Nitrospirota bacterium]
MTDSRPPFSPDQIGSSPVRFSSTGIFETHKDHMVNPYAFTQVPKVAQVEGIQFTPQAKGQYPAIVLLHDRWGLVTPVKEMALRLACEGYVVLVPNLYGRQGGMVTANADVAQALMERLNEDQVLQDINASCEFLNANLAEDAALEQTKRNLHGVVGLGMGGALALRFACRRRRLKAAVAFYSLIPDGPEIAKQLWCPVLYHAVAPEESAPDEQLEAFRQVAEREGKDVRIERYADASIGFCDETYKERYRPDLAKQAWDTTITFLNSILRAS